MKGKTPSESSKQRILILPGENRESAGIVLSCRCESFGTTFSYGMLAVRFIG